MPDGAGLSPRVRELGQNGEEGKDVRKAMILAMTIAVMLLVASPAAMAGKKKNKKPKFIDCANQTSDSE